MEFFFGRLKVFVFYKGAEYNNIVIKTRVTFLAFEYHPKKPHNPWQNGLAECKN